MKYWLILFAFIIAAPAYSIEKSSPEKNSTAECVDKLSPFEWRNHLDEIEQQLASARDAKIKTIIPMKDYLQSLGHKPSGTTDCFFIEFADGMQAVWKPEDHVWGSHGEVAAFHAARLIGMRNVPPAVLTELQGRKGVLSYFVKTSIDIKSMTRKQQDEVLAKVSPKELSDMQVFHFLFGQNDRHFGNILVDDEYRLVLIDNEALTMLTQFNLNGTSWAQRAVLKPELRDGVDQFRGTPFPFDRIRHLNLANPQIVENFLKNTQIKRENLMRQVSSINSQILPIVFWRDAFWSPTRANSLPLSLDILSVATLQKIRSLYYEPLRAVFHEPYFSKTHLELIFQRRDQILQKAKTAHLID